MVVLIKSYSHKSASASSEIFEGGADGKADTRREGNGNFAEFSCPGIVPAHSLCRSWSDKGMVRLASNLVLSLATAAWGGQDCELQNQVAERSLDLVNISLSYLY